MFERFNKQYETANKKGPAFDFKVQTNGKGLGGRAAMVSMGGKIPKIIIDVSKLAPGTLPHEVFHVLMRKEFQSDLGMAAALKTAIQGRLSKIDWDFGEEGKQGELQKGLKKNMKKCRIRKLLMKSMLQML